MRSIAAIRNASLVATVTAVVPAQFTAPYSGVGPAVRSSPLPIVVMKYEPNTPFDYNRYVLLGRSGNRLYQIAKDRDSTWHKRVELSFPSSRSIADDPVPFRNPAGDIASVFVLASNGVIYQSYTRRHDEFGSWSQWNGLPANILMASTCAPVNTPSGSGVSAVAVGRNGLLHNIFFTRGSSTGWGSWSAVPGSPQLTGRPAAVNSTGGQVLHVFAVDTAGALRHVRFTRGGVGWSAWSTLANLQVVGSPTCYALGGLVSVFATSSNGQIYQKVYGNGSWGPWTSLGSPSSGSFISGPSAVNTPDGSALEIVARTSLGTVERKVYTRNGGGWSSWQPIDVGGSLSGGPTLTNWHSSTATTAQTRQQFFGTSDSVTHWFEENSQGNFPVTEAFVSDWLLMPDDPNTPVNESSYEYFHGPDYAGKARLMIEAFEGLTGFRFANYDSNNDGKVTTDELMVFWVYPGEGARVRGAPLCISVPSLSGCGVSLDLGLPRSAAHIHPATICEELCHALFGLDDLYPTPQLPGYVGPGQLTLISNNAAFPHLHPWGKMKLGWVRPTVVTQDGWHSLRPIEFFPDLLLVHDPTRGPRDYFLVENRWPDNSIEHALPDRGIGVWRIGEHYAGQPHWGRRTIHLLRAGGGTNDGVAFWDAGDPRTAYHLTPTSVPADSRWEDGSNSNIAIYHFPAASPSALVYVDVPPLRSQPPPPHQFADYGYIDQPSPYQNPSPNWLTALTRPVLGQELILSVPTTYVASGNFTGYYLITGASSPAFAPPELNGFLFASLDLLTSPTPPGSPGRMTQVRLPLPADPSLTGAVLYQQVIRLDPAIGFPLGVSRGGRLRLGF